MWYVKFKRGLALLFLPWLLSLLIQTAGRLYLLLDNLSLEKVFASQHEVISALLMGLRFDLRIACMTFGSLLIFSLPLLFCTQFTLYWTRARNVIVVMLLALITAITVVNVFYFITYNRYIDVFIFAFKDDDTRAIVKTLWSDYPIVRGGTALVILTVCYSKLIDCWQHYLEKKIKNTRPLWVALPVVMLTLVSVFIGCRGSTGTFPLRQDDAQVCRDALLNMFVPNGVIATDWAWHAYKNSNVFEPMPQKESQLAIKQFFHRDRPNAVTIFMETTADSPIAANKPPHVIFAVMESMGSHLFEFDNARRDLFGTLRPHWQRDWVFARFISEGDGTIDSLSRFFVRSPLDKISQSSGWNSNFTSNMFTPFKKNGYKLIFITAGNGAWRNLNQFLPHLGVDEFIEQNTLLHEFPDATLGTWGVPDEYMFKYANKRLQQAEQQGEHVMMVLLSATHHPPYRLPPGQPYSNYRFSAAEQARLKNMGDAEQLRTIFNTFHYSNTQLGNFITQIKSQPLMAHTIIAATGDHNMRGIGYADPAEMVLGHAVPFYLYVPKRYQYRTHYDPSRVGSHKDILPTLYYLSLSNTAFYQTGCNLLAEQADPLWCNAGYNPNILIDDRGAYTLAHSAFYPWKSTSGLRVLPNETLTAEQQQQIMRWQAWSKLMRWQLVEQVNQQRVP